MEPGREVVIVEAVRTPVGRRGGGLSTTHPVDLLAALQRSVEAAKTSRGEDADDEKKKPAKKAAAKKTAKKAAKKKAS